MRFHLQCCHPTAMSKLQTLLLYSSSKQKSIESKQLSLAEALNPILLRE